MTLWHTYICHSQFGTSRLHNCHCHSTVWRATTSYNYNLYSFTRCSSISTEHTEFPSAVLIAFVCRLHHTIDMIPGRWDSAAILAYSTSFAPRGPGPFILSLRYSWGLMTAVLVSVKVILGTVFCMRALLKHAAIVNMQAMCRTRLVSLALQNCNVLVWM